MNIQNQSKLRSKARVLKPIVWIGKNGLNSDVFEEINRQLDKKELIKIKLTKSFIDEKDKKKRKQKIREAKQKAKERHKEEQSRPELVLTRPQKEKLAYYTVEAWKKLDKSEIRDLIAQGFESKTSMNE